MIVTCTPPIVVATLPVGAREGGVIALAFSSDGKSLAGSVGPLASRQPPCVVVLWDAATHRELMTLRGHTWRITGLAFSPDNRTLASGGEDKTARLWDVVTGHEIGRIEENPNWVRSVAYSPDGKTLAAGGSGDATIRVWNLETGKIEHLLNSHTVNGLAFSPDGTLVSAGCSDSKVLVWDVANQKARMTLEGHAKHRYKGRDEDFLHLNTLAVAPDGRTAASGSNDGTMRFWPIAPREQPKK